MCIRDRPYDECADEGRKPVLKKSAQFIDGAGFHGGRKKSENNLRKKNPRRLIVHCWRHGILQVFYESNTLMLVF